MKSSLNRVLALSVCFFLFYSQVAADTYTYTKHSDYQAVNALGAGTWPGEGNELYYVALVGVVINNPEDMHDYTDYSVPTDVWWQTFIQAQTLPESIYGGYTISSDDFGGTALYMRSTNPKSGAVLYELNGEEGGWIDELDGRDGDGMLTNAATLQYGDIVVVEAKAPGMFYCGKYNINEKHDNDPAMDFTVTVVGHTDPVAETITLAALKDEYDDFIFDSSRGTGCEHYQGSLVHLDNLLLLDADGWGLDGSVTVMQGNLTFELQLGIDTDLLSIDAESLETTEFSITAILDQETDRSGPFDVGYRLWLTSASKLTPVPEPGTLALLAAGLAAMLFWRRRIGR